jgi:Fe-S oxidoreductase
MGDAYADIPRHGGDFAKAVAVCINSRQCETNGKGVMCPSFRATDNPHLSPGGRVKLLKQALNGDLAQSALLDPNLAEAIDLCLACKGCKRECENNIDMAMIKTEVLAQRIELKGLPLRTRLIANLPKLSRLPGFPSLMKWRNRLPFLAKLLESTLGLVAKRSFPEVSGRINRFIVNQPMTGNYNGEVVLLIDSFTRNFTPKAIEASLSLLLDAGYRVYTTDMPIGENKANQNPPCCGRTQIANGLVEDARKSARHMLEVLRPHVEAGRKIIGLEPACLLAIRDDYRFLGLGELAEQASSQALLLEEFIVREKAAGRFKLEFDASSIGNQPLLVHGHCHQKAVGAMKSVRKTLKMVPGLEFEMIEASCCGMAGSFGLEKEHSELSLDIAELSLFPKLREHAEAPIIANGFSCRHQIKDGLNRESIHLAELLYSLSTQPNPSNQLAGEA